MTRRHASLGPAARTLNRLRAPWLALVFAVVLVLAALGHSTHLHASDTRGQTGACAFCVAFERGAAPVPTLPLPAVDGTGPAPTLGATPAFTTPGRWAAVLPRAPPVLP